MAVLCPSDAACAAAPGRSVGQSCHPWELSCCWEVGSGGCCVTHALCSHTWCVASLGLCSHVAPSCPRRAVMSWKTRTFGTLGLVTHSTVGSSSRLLAPSRRSAPTARTSSKDGALLSTAEKAEETKANPCDSSHIPETHGGIAGPVERDLGIAGRRRRSKLICQTVWMNDSMLGREGLSLLPVLIPSAFPICAVIFLLSGWWWK